MLLPGGHPCPLLLFLCFLFGVKESQHVRPPEPLSTESPLDIGFLSLQRPSEGITAPQQERFCWAESHRALPTNAWWVPAVLHSSSIGINYITQLPYVFNLLASQLMVHYPHLQAATDEVSHVYPTNPWSISALSPMPNGYCVSKADPFTATFVWMTNGVKTMQSTLVRGSPYVTMQYTAAVPKLSIGQNVSKYFIDGEPALCDGQVAEGQRLVLQFHESDEEWTVFFPLDTPVRCLGNASHTALEVAQDSFTGTLRLALSNNCTTGRSPLCDHPGTPNNDLSEFRSALARGSWECITGSALSYEEKKEVLRVTVQWKKEHCFAMGDQGEVLLYALPHQVPLFACEEEAKVVVVPNGGHRNLRGYNQPVVTTEGSAQWVWLIPNQPMPWVSDPEPERLSALRQAVQDESHWGFDSAVMSGTIDPYFGGKELAKMARLILLADELDGHDHGQGNITLNFLDQLKTRLINWFDARQNALMYDVTWGGIVSCGCKAKQNPSRQPFDGWYCANDPRKAECTSDDIMSEFGNGLYNDHHFHYGYWIYAAAVVAKFDKSFLKGYNDHVLALIRDISNPSAADPYFTPWRYFDWFVGHAWAGGIFPIPEGRNQESTSESINAWYAIALYGEASGNPAVEVMGKAQALMELLSAKYYWHVQAHEDLYPKEFKRHMVGILFDSKVTSWTWFGHESWKVHGIQIIPITPIIHHLFSPEFAKREFTMYDRACDADPNCAHGGFRVFAVAEEAFIDKKGAWTNAMRLPNSDFEGTAGGGNSRTNTLYFISSWGRYPRSQWERPIPHLCPFDRAFPWEPADQHDGWLGKLAATCVAAALVMASIAFFLAQRSPMLNEELRPFGNTAQTVYGEAMAEHHPPEQRLPPQVPDEVAATL